MIDSIKACLRAMVSKRKQEEERGRRRRGRRSSRRELRALTVTCYVLCPATKIRCGPCMARQRSPGLIACPRAERRFFFLSYFFLAHTSSGLEQNFFFLALGFCFWTMLIADGVFWTACVWFEG